MKNLLYRTLKYTVCFLIVPAIVGLTLAVIVARSEVKPKPVWIGTYRITAYHAVVAECDNEPDIGSRTTECRSGPRS